MTEAEGERKVAMTDQEQIIALAELSGWKYTEYGWLWLLGSIQPDYPSTPPNFLTDLNAVHELENKLYLQGIYAEFYVSELYDIVPIRPKENSHCKSFNTRRFEIINATARQRCEAILRATGKWKE